ncbi:MAG: FAD-dependent oxidoreductase, partial [bacterium]
MDKLDCVIIGAGVVGLAVAREMALSGREVFILEATEGIGNEASSRNSEVIHAGIYYLPDSLKAILCVRGKELLYEYCAEREINHKRIGKIIVAADKDEVPELERIRSQAQLSGVDDLVWLTDKEVVSIEPKLSCVSGLLSPSTGIIDSHSLMEELLSDAKDAGAELVLSTKVEGGRISDGGIVLDVGGSEPMTILCRTVINCAGMHAQAVARSIEGIPAENIPKSYICK